MSAQQSLTFLFDAIALGFIAIATIDLSQEIIKLYQQVFVTPQQPPLTNSQPQALLQLPDPWLLPLEETTAPVKRCLQEQPKPILLLAPAQAVEEVRLSRACAVQPSTTELVKELLEGINVDTLKLRPARKLAKLLGIAQKVNGRDQTLAFLRSQIKLKFQQSLQPEVAFDLREKLIAC